MGGKKYIFKQQRDGLVRELLNSMALIKCGKSRTLLFSC